MTPADADLAPVDVALGAAVLIAAGAAVIPRSRFAQSMGYLVLSVLVSLIWLQLETVDVGLAEAGVGGGILSALLVWVTIRSPASVGHHAGADPHGPGAAQLRHRIRPGLGVVAGAALVFVLSSVWLRVEQSLPSWEEPLAAELPGTGVTHEVTGVLLGFRAYDTLLESAVVMMAGVAALALGRDGGLHQAYIPQPAVPSTLRWLARLLAPVLLLVGLWFLFAGSSDSGGAFQSGTVLCALLILLRTAHFSSAELTARWLRPVLVAGVAVFILAGLVGPLLADPVGSQPWLSWDPSWAYAAVLTVEVTLTAGIAAGLYLLYLTLENPQGVQ